MTYIVEVLRQEHRNIEKLLWVLERELMAFDRGETRSSSRPSTTLRTTGIPAITRRRT